jgi:N-acetyl-anhydromuramyl-L-alanine amidase AmpD
MMPAPPARPKPGAPAPGAPPTPPPAATPEVRSTPLAPVPSTSEHRQYFVPASDYHELPPESYAQNLIQPQEIIVHWDGNQHARALWLAPVTFDTLRFTQQSAHFAVDYKQAWQLLPMYQTVVQQSYGAKGYNWESINIEMAGTDFDLPANQPPESEVQRTLQLVSMLMDYYQIDSQHVAGHYERDPSRLKHDPGVKFMAAFRQRLQSYRLALAPSKRIYWSASDG